MALYTYDDTSRREDLLSILRDVSPTADNYLVTNLGKSQAQGTLHEWLVRNIDRPSSVTAAAEGFTATEPVGDAPTRSNNITAIFKREVKVSGTEKEVRRGLPGDAMDDEKKVKLMRLKADMEFSLINGAYASGASGTARGMAGINAVISSNMTARASGTSMSVTELDDLLQNSWDAVGSTGVADLVLCPMGIKRKIGGFTTGVTRYTTETERLYNNVAVYESPVGIVKIVPHKDINNAAGTTHVYAIKEEMFKMAFLREPFYKPLATTGDYEQGVYITEMTLESLQQKTSVKRTGYAVLG